METKTCPRCHKKDLEFYAEICKHCGKNVQEFYDKPIGWGLLGVIVGLAGFFYWPLFIIAALCLVLQYIQSSK